MKLAVIGLGRVGLPLALAFASKNVQVIGMDTNGELIDTLQKGEMPFIEEGAEEILRSKLGNTFACVFG